MKFSKVIFRITFWLLAIVYLAVLTEFLNPAIFDVDVEISYDVVALTVVVIGFLYVFLKRSKHH